MVRNTDLLAFLMKPAVDVEHATVCWHPDPQATTRQDPSGEEQGVDANHAGYDELPDPILAENAS